jgi:hypothetical protein
MSDSTAEQVEFIINKVRWMPHVLEVKHTNDRGVLLKLIPSKKLYFIIFMGVMEKGSRNYPNAIAERFEGEQPHCCIGTYPADTELSEAISLADKGNAVWHTTAPGVPINRVIEEIIKMDYGMRVFGCFIP